MEIMTFIDRKTDERYKRAIEKWGKDAQTNMIIEECAELSEACNKIIIYIMKLGRANKNKTDMQIKQNLMLLEMEIADVEIMLEQAHYIFDGEFINKIKKEKLERLEKRLNGISEE
jgi:hypothetical protein